MAFVPSSPVTGATMTGLTSPTYTLSADTAVKPTMKSYTVSALGGTQTGVTVHSIASPFTVSMVRPAVFKLLGQPNSAGVIRAFPKNTFDVLCRKGLTVLANQPTQLSVMRLSSSIPAGGESYDPVNLRAQISCMIGVLWQIANDLDETFITGTI